MGSPTGVIVCMNTLCGATVTCSGIRGWGLKSGGFLRNSVYCDTYHNGEEGWRKCNTCDKRIHCGCIASKHMHDYMDYGGVWCKNCESRLTQQQALVPYVAIGHETGHESEKLDDLALVECNLMSSQDPDSCSPVRQVRKEGQFLSLKAPDAGQSSTSTFPKAQNPPDQLFTIPQIPTQLLAKHKPKICDVELQELFGDLNMPVTPLFQKVLSVSDAGKTGRLIIPKVCAEAYLPSLSDSTGLPLKLLDANGKEWTFQLRFWINNNGRMYVFEGAQRYMREMGLQAGDIVIFGRVLDDKLVIGFKKKPGACNTKHKKNCGIEVTCRQAQDLFQPNCKSKIVMIENYEFEEFNEPPVFGYGEKCSAQVTGSSQSRPMKRVENALQSSKSPGLKKLKIIGSHIRTQGQSSSSNACAMIANTGVTSVQNSEIAKETKKVSDVALQSNFQVDSRDKDSTT